MMREKNSNLCFFVKNSLLHLTLHFTAYAKPWPELVFLYRHFRKAAMMVNGLVSIVSAQDFGPAQVSVNSRCQAGMWTNRGTTIERLLDNQDFGPAQVSVNSRCQAGMRTNRGTTIERLLDNLLLPLLPDYCIIIISAPERTHYRPLPYLTFSTFSLCKYIYITIIPLSVPTPRGILLKNTRSKFALMGRDFNNGANVFVKVVAQARCISSLVSATTGTRNKETKNATPSFLENWVV